MAHELCHKAQLVLWIQVILAEVDLTKHFKNWMKKEVTICPFVGSQTGCGNRFWKLKKIAENCHLEKKSGIFTCCVFYLLLADALLGPTGPFERENLKSTSFLIKTEKKIKLKKKSARD